MRRKTFAFTLIELLVVITIIAVLLALLTPALDKAIYQAELAVCGARQAGVATGALTYAAEYRRHYPYRAAVFGRGSLSYTLAEANRPEWDLRLVIRNHININALGCPLTGRIDLAGSQASSWTTTPYAMWFGFRYSYNGVEDQGMFRLGDRMGFTDNSNSGPAVYRFRILTGDLDIRQPPSWLGNHQDRPAGQSLSYQEVLQDSYRDPVNGQCTVSRWDGVYARGTIDSNFAFDDGAVARLDEITFDDTTRRLRGVPKWANGSEWPNYKVFIPAE